MQSDSSDLDATRQAQRSAAERLFGVRDSFHRQLFRSLLLAIALPILVLGAVRVALFVAYLEQSRRGRLQDAAEGAAALVGGALERKLRTLESLALLVEESPEAFDTGELSARLAAVHREQPDFLTFAVTDEAGAILAAERRLDEGGGPFPAELSAVADRPYFLWPRETGRSYVSDGFVGRGLGSDPIVAISHPWRLDRGGFGGVVEGSLSPASFAPYVDIFLGLPGVELYVVDRGRRLLWGSPELEVPPLAPVELDARGARPLGGDPGRYLSGRAEVANVGWTVVVQQPLAAVVATTWPQVWITLVWMVAAFLIASVLAWWIARRVRAPLESLAAAVARVDLAQLDSGGMTLPERAPRELVGVSRALGGLLLRLRASYGELSRVLARQEQTIAERTRDLRASEERARMLIDQSLAFVATHDLDGRLLTVNPAAARALGVDSGALVGRALADVVPERVRPLVAEYLERIRAAAVDEGLMQVRTAAGEEPVWRYHNRVVRTDGEAFVLGFAVDVTEHLLAQAELARRAEFDALTGAVRREVFERHVARAIAVAERRALRCALVYLDLDAFKPVNDRFGHAAGDHVLGTVGERLRERVRGTDTVARLGGDEFAVLLFEVESRAQAERVAEILATRVTEPIAWESGELRVGVSVGIAVYPDDGCTSADLEATADREMLTRKRARRAPP